MSASPEVSAPAPQGCPSGSPNPASNLATEAKDDIDSQEDQAPKNEGTPSVQEPETDASKSQSDKHEKDELTSAPPLPDEAPPPLPTEAPPAQPEDDGWHALVDRDTGLWYYWNRFTRETQWENPRVPQVAAAPAVAIPAVPAIPAAPGTDDNHESAAPEKEPIVGGYNPAIHGDYDPTAPYAQYHEEPAQPATAPGFDPSAAYAATGTFNRFTGRWQAATINPENHNDENKSRRQMNAFFDVDAAANSHDGRSLRAERSAKKLTKQELKQFKEKRREKKEEKRRAWLRD
ncbi:WW/Rsp5/WWP [Penicillium cf. griseofulvum]|uniref:WW/Rsp5/WWP n=1 Tax=Penicillium cf. griseofulvum TaxID=2972120 RepID=A0A9W9JLQ3_9EURO|nr:WW/Rsp5/WWP [Penicillium cf. griseofulvum]KAJ5442025.1 WW/Rsp5/WWP [Penicillium cf. griseofulvum]KAJ5451004.1 WW/Rsp5/WWP [Penicillium cf. griseofulvum]